MIDINETVDNNRPIMDDMLMVPGLTGCDTVVTYHGIGKCMALNVLRSGTLPNVGDMALSVKEGLCWL